VLCCAVLPCAARKLKERSDALQFPLLLLRLLIIFCIRFPSFSSLFASPRLSSPRPCPLFSPIPYCILYHLLPCPPISQLISVCILEWPRVVARSSCPHPNFHTAVALYCTDTVQIRSRGDALYGHPFTVLYCTVAEIAQTRGRVTCRCAPLAPARGRAMRPASIYSHTPIWSMHSGTAWSKRASVAAMHTLVEKEFPTRSLSRTGRSSA
jgi:hypothetical protein